MRGFRLILAGVVFAGSYACDMGKKGSFSKKDPTLKLAILGDSLVVGVMAETKMGGELPAENYLYKHLFATEGKELAGKDLSEEEKRKRRTEYVRRNDDAYKKKENAYSYGKKGDCSFSHACRMGLDKDEFRNFAVSGSKVGDLDAQLAELASIAGKAEHYIIEVGANDFCANDFNKEKYLKGLKRLIAKVLGQNVQAKVLVVPIPNVVYLFEEVAMPADVATVVRGKSYTCGQIRDGGLGRRKYCPHVSDATDRAGLKTEIKEVNDAILGLTGQYDNNRVKFAEAVSMTRFGKKHLAADCFHASEEGLKLLAAETWKYQRTFN